MSQAPTAPQAPLPAPPLAQAPYQNVRSAKRNLRTAGIVAAVAGTLLSLLFLLGETGPLGLITGLLLAFLPAPVYLALALLIDRFEPEPLKMLAWAFAWGAVGAFPISFVINSVGSVIVGSGFGQEVGQVFAASISAPIVEETAKGLALFALYRWRRSEFNGVVDGVVYAAMVALGFATVENVLYYGRAAAEGGISVQAIFFLRGVLSPFSHPLYTAMTGLGLGLAVQTRNRNVKTVAPILGLLGAILLHAIWNTAATGGAVVVYPLLMVPIFIGSLVAIRLFRRREAQLVRHALQPELQSGLVTPQELEQLSSAQARRRATKAAKQLGPGAVQLCRDYHDAATEIAFYRQRRDVAYYRGEPAPAEDERAYVERFRLLREQFASQSRQPQPSPQAAPSTTVATAGAPPAPPTPAAPAPQPQASPAVPASWYPDPYGQRRLRYWDGSAWTQHVAD